MNALQAVDVETSPRLYDATINFFSAGDSRNFVAVPADRRERLRGCPRVHTQPVERESLGTLRVAEALWNLDDPFLAQMGDRLIECATNRNSWRCQISTVCPRCGRRAASRERQAIEELFENITTSTVLVTRTVHAPSIVEGHRSLLHARRAQGRSSAWQSTFSYGRGRIEAVPTDDGRWLVHAHEVCVLAKDATLPADALARAWAELVVGDGTFDARMIRPAPAARTFVPSIFYSTKRRRTELLAFTDEELREWCLTVPRLRWALRFGTTEESSHG